MPNIRAQIVGPLGDKAVSALPGDDVGLYIQASDGREVTITKRAIIADFLQETGTRLQRRVKTILWIRQTIRDALGVEQIDMSLVDADFDDNDGTPSRLEVRGA